MGLRLRPEVLHHVRPPHRGLSVEQAPESTAGQIAPRLKLCAESAGCRSVEVVAVVRTVRELQRALTILENWTKTSTASGPSAAPEPDSAARREIARIEQAIRAKDERVLEEYGDLQVDFERGSARAAADRRVHIRHIPVSVNPGKKSSKFN